MTASPPLASTPPSAPSAGRCPIDHTAKATDTARSSDCPIAHDSVRGRSRADHVARSVLRIKDRPDNLSKAAALGSFQRSMLISALRCTLTYVVFPFVLPAVGLAARVGPVLGIAIGLVAMVCDVFTIRRFFQVDHRWRWAFSALALAVIGLLSVLLVQDIIDLAS